MDANKRLFMDINIAYHHWYLYDIMVKWHNGQYESHTIPRGMVIR